MSGAIGTILLVWGIVLFIVGTAILITGILYYRKGKAYHDAQKALLVEAEKRVKLQYNKIATLSPDKLNVYIGGIFSRYLELNGELGTTKDNLVLERLFAGVQADVLDFLGEDTIAAIEYYYGANYVEKWSKLAYLILEKRRKLGGIVEGNTGYEELEHLLTNEMSFGGEAG